MREPESSGGRRSRHVQSNPLPFADARARLNGTYYGLCYLSLAWQAYAKYPAAIPSGIAAMPVPEELTGGYQWRCAWGPVSDADDPTDLSGPNLAYVVALDEVSGGLVRPVFAAVVLRGTDLALSLTDDWIQVAEDLNVGTQEPWAYPPHADAKIAVGTSEALGKLVAATDPARGQTLFGFLDEIEGTARNIPIVVTGHSLGGCLTTVIAPYLAWKFNGAVDILANPIAPPSAGNSTFGDVYLGCLSKTNYPNGSSTWVNTHDPAPYCWNHSMLDPDVKYRLQGLYELWGGNPPTPKPLIDGLIGWLDTRIPLVPYVQPMPASPPGLPVQFTTGIKPETGSSAWADEFVYQHFPDTGYWDQIAAINDMGWIPRPPYGETAIGAVVVTGAGQDLALSVYGSGFPEATCNGVPIGAWPYVGNTDQFSVSDLTRGWNAGSTHWPDKEPNAVTLNYVSWSRSQIVIRGLSGKYGGGSGDWIVSARDQLRVSLYDGGSGLSLPKILASATTTAPA